MAKPGLLVDSGALIALANRRETANQAVNRILGDFFGELVTTWPAVTEACHMIPDHLAPVLLAWLGGPRWRVLGHGWGGAETVRSDAKVCRPAHADHGRFDDLGGRAYRTASNYHA